MVGQVCSARYSLLGAQQMWAITGAHPLFRDWLLSGTMR